MERYTSMVPAPFRMLRATRLVLRGIASSRKHDVSNENAPSNKKKVFHFFLGEHVSKYIICASQVAIT